MEVSLPSNFEFIAVNEFRSALGELKESTENSFTFSLNDNAFALPYGILLLANAIKEFVTERPDAKFAFKIRDSPLASYLGHMGFFQATGVPIGKAPGEAKGSDVYLPATKINLNEFRKYEKQKGEHLVETIERVAKNLSIVSSHNNNLILEVLTYSIREIVRNIFEHSYSDDAWYCGQFWPRNNKVEIVILDHGIGILQSLLKNSKLGRIDEVKALQLALQPGISSVTQRNPDDDYANSGYGLFLTSKICSKAGALTLQSGNTTILISDKMRILNTPTLKGTMVRMVLDISLFESLEKMLTKFRTEGESLARNNRLTTHLIASASSGSLKQN